MSQDKAKYVMTHAIRGATPRKVGSIIELTEEQARHPLYRNRVRKADLVPAEEKDEDLNKGEIIQRLKELEIEYDGRKSAEDLAALLPK